MLDNISIKLQYKKLVKTLETIKNNYQFTFSATEQIIKNFQGNFQNIYFTELTDHDMLADLGVY
jgi:DNA-directed RNA polymerase subunit L